jgi:hypothetical protein
VAYSVALGIQENTVICICQEDCVFIGFFIVSKQFHYFSYALCIVTENA